MGMKIAAFYILRTLLLQSESVYQRGSSMMNVVQYSVEMKAIYQYDANVVSIEVGTYNEYQIKTTTLIVPAA